jgi:hypothetical protein
MEPAVGVEPTTLGLRYRCSTTELSRRQKGQSTIGLPPCQVRAPGPPAQASLLRILGQNDHQKDDDEEQDYAAKGCAMGVSVVKVPEVHGGKLRVQRAQHPAGAYAQPTLSFRFCSDCPYLLVRPRPAGGADKSIAGRWRPPTGSFPFPRCSPWAAWRSAFLPAFSWRGSSVSAFVFSWPRVQRASACRRSQRLPPSRLRPRNRSGETQGPS